MTSARIRVLILALCDAFCLIAVFMLTTFLYQRFGSGQYPLSLYAGLAPAMLIFLLINGLIRLYHGNFFYPGAMLPPQEELRRLVFSTTLTYLLLFAYLMLIRESHFYSRFVLLVSWALTCVFVMPLRNIARILMKRYGIGQIRVLIAGAGKTGLGIAETFRRDEHFGFNPVGFIDDAAEALPEGFPPVLGKMKDMAKVAAEHRIGYLVCCLPLNVIHANFRGWLVHFQHVTIIPTDKVLPGAWAYSISFGVFSGLEIRNQLLLPGPRVAKAVLEALMSFFGIICLIPLLAVLAVLVKLTSRGPVFYKAKRLGLNGREITVWKFRTMRQDADEYLKKMLESDPVLAAEWKEKFKLEHDPRITPFGNFLRKTSLDELPQLFNVLTGEMAMIGPRPIVKAEVEYYGENYKVFSRVKPGITGLWQISGRSETTYEQRVNFDLSYIMNWSVWLDIYILMRTVLEVIRCRGAK